VLQDAAHKWKEIKQLLRLYKH